jgi:F-type H+-transporting ATPase subunit a
MGCPIIIRFFIVIIEIIRILIRPITLRVRISANLLAGHLLIHLLTEFSFFLLNLRFLNLFITLLFIIILNLLEIGVGIIQSYILCTLLNIYLCETSN